MKKEDLRAMLVENGVDELVFKGGCHDCGRETEVVACIEDGEPFAQGGSVYKVALPSIREDNIFIKCEDCFNTDKILRNWRPTEVYSRVVGYLRPVEQWNKGKKAEWVERKVYTINGKK